jgi:hypothetical protein
MSELNVELTFFNFLKVEAQGGLDPPMGLDQRHESVVDFFGRKPFFHRKIGLGDNRSIL